MDLALNLALYFTIWWISLFAVMPFGRRTQGEEGSVVPGTPPSAPVGLSLKRIFLINSLVAAVLFAIVWTALEYNLLNLRAPEVPY